MIERKATRPPTVKWPWRMSHAPRPSTPRRKRVTIDVHRETEDAAEEGEAPPGAEQPVGLDGEAVTLSVLRVRTCLRRCWRGSSRRRRRGASRCPPGRRASGSGLRSPSPGRRRRRAARRGARAMPSIGLRVIMTVALTTSESIWKIPSPIASVSPASTMPTSENRRVSTSPWGNRWYHVEGRSWSLANIDCRMSRTHRTAHPGAQVGLSHAGHERDGEGHREDAEQRQDLAELSARERRVEERSRHEREHHREREAEQHEREDLRLAHPVGPEVLE